MAYSWRTEWTTQFGTIDEFIESMVKAYNVILDKEDSEIVVDVKDMAAHFLYIDRWIREEKVLPNRWQ